MALKLEDGKEPSSSGSYENNELVTYEEARKSSNPQPYIAAVVTSKNENMFILGDGRNTSNPTSRRRRSTLSDYYNGPLEPGTSYSIFQRIFINEKVHVMLMLSSSQTLVTKMRNTVYFQPQVTLSYVSLLEQINSASTSLL